jgi:hypothetical protein
LVLILIFTILRPKNGKVNGREYSILRSSPPNKTTSLLAGQEIDDMLGAAKAE